MYQGKTLFSQVMDFLPRKQFRKCVDRFGNYCRCYKNPNLDCNLNSYAGYYHEKEIEIRPEPFYNCTDFEFDPFLKEILHFMGPYR